MGTFVTVIDNQVNSELAERYAMLTTLLAAVPHADIAVGKTKYSENWVKHLPGTTGIVHNAPWTILNVQLDPARVTTRDIEKFRLAEPLAKKYNMNIVRVWYYLRNNSDWCEKEFEDASEVARSLDLVNRYVGLNFKELRNKTLDEAMASSNPKDYNRTHKHRIEDHAYCLPGLKFPY